MSIAASHRPDPDELAAFIDGQLSAEERRKLEAHLGACEACREVVAESLVLLEDLAEAPATSGRPECEGAEGVEPKKARVLTHPGWQRTLWQLGPLAAAALVVLLLWPTLTSSQYGPANSAELIASYADPQDLLALSEEDWIEKGWAVYRGSYVESLSEEQIAFRLGVRSVDLQVALRVGSEADRLQILNELIVLLRDGVVVATPLRLRLEEIRDSIAEVSAEQTLQESSLAEEDLEETLDSDYFSLGRWTEAGRMATMIGDDAYFGNRWFGRQAGKLGRIELRPEAAEPFQHIRTVADGPLDQNSLRTLREAFEEIILTTG